MQRRTTALSAVLALILILGIVPAVTVVASADAATRVSAIKLLKQLDVAKETHSSSYVRANFKLWVDSDHDCKDTRAEVLVTESRATTTGDCTIKTGEWKSLYDGKTITVASKLDIDHMVPLAEAWRSGAYRWSAEKREAYANDLGFSWSLVAVSASSNRSKGDSDPAEWLPAKNKCTYVEAWVSVKWRWKLHVDSAEKKAALRVLRGCDSVSIAKPNAPVISTLIVKTTTTVTTPTTTTVTITPPVVTPPIVTPPVVTPPATGTDPRYATCTAAKAAHAHTPYYRGVNPEYYWYDDRDGDGIVCE